MFRAVQQSLFAVVLATAGILPAASQAPPQPEPAPANGASEQRRDDRLDRVDPETGRQAAEADRAAAMAAFVQLDENGDGRLTHEEAQQRSELPGRFEFLDADRDGMLSREEFEPFALRQEAPPEAASP